MSHFLSILTQKYPKMSFLTFFVEYEGTNLNQFLELNNILSFLIFMYIISCMSKCIMLIQNIVLKNIDNQLISD